MFASFRRLSKSKAGTVLVVLFLIAILASFALADLSNFRQGGTLSQGVLAKVGSEQLTEAELSTIMQRELARLREQKPDATYADLAPQFNDIVNGLIQERTLKAYAAKHGLMPSKKLVDAEIVKLPGVRGLDGKFSEAAYQSFLAQQRLTDAQIRSEIVTVLLQRLLLSPLVANTRIPTGVARPYASMLLEERQGEVALIPAAAFRAGPAPTDADLQRFYAENRQRYLVPEQRVLRIARAGTGQLAGVAPTEQEISAYYNANQATYGGGETRVLSRASVPDRAQAEQIARRARAGGNFAAAAAPAGFTAADVSLGPQSRQELAGLAGAQVAAQVFGAASGTVIGPVQSSTGWDVIKVESINRTSGRSLADVRAEIAAKLTADKRKEALTDLVTKMEDEIADGRNFSEVASANRLTVTQTPSITAGGQAPGNTGFKLPPEYAQLVKEGFQLAPTDDPVVETLPGDAGYALLTVGDVTPSAPAPLAQIRDRVAADFLAKRALDRARMVANTVVAKGNAGVQLSRAVADANVPGAPPAAPLTVRRLQLSQLQGQVPPPLQMLFSLSQGKSRLVAAPNNEGYFVVKLNRITPGDATTQPTLVAQVQTDFNRAAGEELAIQFLTAAQGELGVTRNEAAIAAARQRLLAGS
ncbi:MAG TPA: peptidyl-prolyl cis-trans isomerase [Sphingomicrobium sp.]|jgi:peptidyl-prolyl cis-trans isomerase D|nr:peptidyl-prolyl cis-trans isomerase [Sphingomicrobium sp.]